MDKTNKVFIEGFAALVREIRRTRRMTLAHVSIQSGLSVSKLCDIEHGRVPVSTRSASKLIAALGLDDVKAMMVWRQDQVKRETARLAKKLAERREADSIAESEHGVDLKLRHAFEFDILVKQQAINPEVLHVAIGVLKHCMKSKLAADYLIASLEFVKTLFHHTNKGLDKVDGFLLVFASFHSQIENEKLFVDDALKEVLNQEWDRWGAEFKSERKLLENINENHELCFDIILSLHKLSEQLDLSDEHVRSLIFSFDALLSSSIKLQKMLTKAEEVMKCLG